LEKFKAASIDGPVLLGHVDRDLLEGHMGIVEPTHLDKIVEQMHLLKVMVEIDAVQCI
jgi:hypothetical protein